jgi:hypothetical protein
MLNIRTEVKISKGTARTDSGGVESIKLRPNSFEVNGDWDNISKTAKISFYLKPFIFNDGILKFKENETEYDIYIGDKIEIKCYYEGYETEYDNIVFKGYISDFLQLGSKSQRLLVSIKCEDEFWLFNNNSLDSDESIMIDKSFTKLTLKDVIDIATTKVSKVHGIDVESKVWDLNDIISFNIKKEITPAELLELIKKRYLGIRVFFREDKNGVVKLYVGWSFWFDQTSAVDNVTDYSKLFKYTYTYDYTSLPLINYDLKFSTTTKSDLFVKITTTNKENTIKLIGKYPLTGIDENSALVTKIINFNDGSYTQAELNSNAKGIWDNTEVGSLTGSFDVFGFPKIRHGDKIQATRYFNEKTRVDNFIVKSVTTKMSKGGFRNNIKLISGRDE